MKNSATISENVLDELKKNWISQRKLDIYNLNWFYTFYIENGGTPINIMDFQQLIQMYLQNNKDAIIKEMDRYFKLSILYDVNKKFIKVVV